MERSTNQVDWVAFPGEASFVVATNRAEFFRVKGLLMERMERVVEQ